MLLNTEHPAVLITCSCAVGRVVERSELFLKYLMLWSHSLCFECLVLYKLLIPPPFQNYLFHLEDE